MEGVYEYQSHTHSIYNTWALAMLLRWIPEVPPPQREWVAECLYDIISFSAHNRQRCCGAGLITVVVEVIVSSQEGGFSEAVEGERASGEGRVCDCEVPIPCRGAGAHHGGARVPFHSNCRAEASHWCTSTSAEWPAGKEYSCFFTTPPPSPLTPPPSPVPLQPTYYYRVQKALSVMSHDLTQDGAVPLYYFDLRAKHSVSDL